MARTNTPDARNRILQAAVKVFADRSFEGSRIDEIAEEAKVPKSLIYYHFKNKDEILAVLIRGFIDEYTGLLSIAENDTHQSKAEAFSGRMRNHYREFGMKNADLIRIILMDSLKKTMERPVVFQVVEALVATEEKFVIAGQPDNYNRQERLVAEFFTSMMPVYAYLCFSESWAKYFNIEKEALDPMFLEVINETHGAYHKNHE